MKSRNWANYIIAGIVVCCSLVLLSALAVSIAGFRLGEPHRRVHVDLKNAAGIRVGSLVSYAGKPVGEVSALRPLSREERRRKSDPAYAIRATLALDDEAPKLASDVGVAVAMDSFLGNKFLALTPGSLDATPLADEAIVEADQSDLLTTALRIGKHLDTLLAQAGADYTNLVARLLTITDEADRVVKQGGSLLTNLDATVTEARELAAHIKSDYTANYRNQLHDLLLQFNSLGTNANVAVTRLDTNANLTLQQAVELMQANRANIDKMIAELRVVAQNLKVVSTYAKVLTRRLGEKPSRIIWSRRENELLPSESAILESKNPILTGPSPED